MSDKRIATLACCRPYARTTRTQLCATMRNKCAPEERERIKKRCIQFVETPAARAKANRRSAAKSASKRAQVGACKRAAPNGNHIRLGADSFPVGSQEHEPQTFESLARSPKKRSNALLARPLLFCLLLLLFRLRPSRRSAPAHESHL